MQDHATPLSVASSMSIIGVLRIGDDMRYRTSFVARGVAAPTVRRDDSEVCHTNLHA